MINIKNIIFSENQGKFLKCKLHRINLLCGAVRSGKTYISIIRMIGEIITAPKNAPILLIGKSITTLRRNVLIPMQSICGSKNFQFSTAAKTAKLAGHPIFIDGAADSRAEEKIRGMTLYAAYADELSLYSADFFNMLLSRLSMPGAFLIATTNPDSPSHWLYKNFISRDSDIDLKLWNFSFADNPVLNPVYIEQIKKEFRGVFYDRFILGKWCTADGVIYRDFCENNSKYIVDNVPDDIMMISIGIDYGADRSKTVFVAIAATSGFDKIYIIDCAELVGIHSPPDIYNQFDIFYNRVVKKYGKCQYVFADYGALGQVLSMGLNTYLSFQKLPVKVRDCSKGRIFDRIQLECSLFGQNRLFILSNCEKMIDAFNCAVWDNKKIDTRLDDGHTAEIDYLDAFEYSIYSFRQHINLSSYRHEKKSNKLYISTI